MERERVSGVLKIQSSKLMSHTLTELHRKQTKKTPVRRSLMDPAKVPLPTIIDVADFPGSSVQLAAYYLSIKALLTFSLPSPHTFNYQIMPKKRRSHCQCDLCQQLYDLASLHQLPASTRDSLPFDAFASPNLTVRINNLMVMPMHYQEKNHIQTSLTREHKPKLTCLAAGHSRIKQCKISAKSKLYATPNSSLPPPLRNLFTDASFPPDRARSSSRS